MIRIALVTPMLPVPYDLTRGRFIHETAKSLSKLATVRVYFQQSRYPKLPMVRPRSFLVGHVGSDYRIDGLDVEAFAYPVFPVISRAINGYVSSMQLTPRVAAFKPDVVLAYWVYPDGFAALRAAHKIGVPCVVGALGSDIHVRSGVNDRMTRQTIAGVDALLTVSEAMRLTAISEFGAQPDRVHTVVNGFNTSVFYPRDQASVRAKFGIPSDERMIIYVGRFVEAKGLRELIQAFQQLARQDDKLSLALIGDGVMKAELVSLIDASSLQGRVRIPGGQPPDQVAEWICASNVLTLPSWSEGYPNVVVEGLACGRPVVATDVGGTREILNKSNGILIEPRKSEILQLALDQALRADWDLVAIAESMRRTWDDVAVETLEICRQVAVR